MSAVPFVVAAQAALTLMKTALTRLLRTLIASFVAVLSFSVVLDELKERLRCRR